MLEENKVLKKRLIEEFRRVEGTEIAVEVEEFLYLTVLLKSNLFFIKY